MGGNIDLIARRQNQMSLNQSIWAQKFKSSGTRRNLTLNKIIGQLEGLKLNKFCQNRWVYHQGTCYYFSKAQVDLAQCQALPGDSQLGGGRVQYHYEYPLQYHYQYHYY